MLEKLLQAIEQDPNNPFYKYGVAIEYRNQGDVDKAMRFFEQVYHEHTEYLANYYHYAALLEEEDRTDEAKRVLEEGMALARKQGNQHALAELSESYNILTS